MLKEDDFLSYINNPMTKESLLLVYKSNNVIFERCDLYSDFVQSLLKNVFNTYMGDDFTNLEAQVLHFQWCWNNNLYNFTKENIYINSVKLYEYFLNFMLETFYSVDKTNQVKLETDTLNLWLNIFDYTKIKTRAEMDALIEIYKIFENALIRH